MRIAILSTIENCDWAGTEEVWAQFAAKALEEGHEVMAGLHHTIAANERVVALEQAGLRKAVRKPFRPARLYLMKEKWRSDLKALQQFKPDVLLINSGSLYDVVNIPYLHAFCAGMSCTKMFFCHFAAELLRFDASPFVKSFFQSMDRMIFVSEHNLNLARRQLAMNFKDAVVVMNGSKLSLAAPLPWPHGEKIRFASVARLETLWKGQDVLLEVLAGKEWANRDWELDLYGVGPDEAYIKNLVAFYGLGNKVKLKGYVSAIRELWMGHHMMLLPSRGEGTPLAVLEAMMCGRPIVTTDVGGNKEILEQGVNGWISDVATAPCFGAALNQAWEKKDEWEAMGVNGHHTAQKLTANDPAATLLKVVTKYIKQ